MMYRFSSFVLALLLLVASGQAMAANVAYSSNNTALADADLYDTTASAAKVSAKWNVGACGAGSAATAGTAIDATDTFTICNGHKLALSSDLTLPTTGSTGITVASGGTLEIASGKKLTLGTNGGIVNNGTINLTNGTSNVAITLSGTGTYSGTGVLNSTCSSAAAAAWNAAATWGTATAACGVTVGAGTPPLPSAGSTVSIDTHTITGGSGTVKSLDLATATSKLTLSGALTVSGALKVSNAGGVLTATGQTITLGGDLTTNATGNIVGSPNLVLTDAPHTLTIGAAAITLGTLTLTPPTATTTERKISVVTSGINVTSSSLGVCTDLTAGTTGLVVNTPTTTTIAADDYFCKLAPVAPGVAAPIFSTKEKATVFSQELK